MIMFTLFYVLFSVCVIYPPTEFVSSGLTVASIFATFLGSEDIHFIQYHIRRTMLTIFIHSLLPMGYFIGLILTTEVDILKPDENKQVSNLIFVLFTSAVILPSFVLMNIGSWIQNWLKHPICKKLNLFCNPNMDWLSVAADINIEYRRVDKVCIQTNSINKVIATDNWIIKVTPYTMHIAHQSDASLVLTSSDTHEIAQYDRTEVQFVNIEVKSTRTGVEPFVIRVNALDFKDLQDKIARPIEILSNVKFHKSLQERFIDAFKEQISLNAKYQTSQELEPCIGCMQAPPNVKLQKLCGSSGENACGSCYCRPMWCADCMAKWFASRQDENVPDTWFGCKCTCPLCRTVFCILDVSFIEPQR